MARARNIKPGFFKNEDLAECTVWARLLFPGLWMLADREGRLENRPKRIKGEIFPFDNVDVQPLLDELESWKFIKRYEVCGVKCIQIVSFADHQSPHGTEKDSELPCENGFLTVNERNKGAFVTGKSIAVPYGEPLNNGIEVGSSPPNNGATTVNPPLDTGAITVNPPLDNALNPDSLIPDSLIPDSLIPEYGDSAIASQTPKPEKPAKRATPIPGDFYPNETGVAYADERRVSMAVELRSFCNHHQAKGTTMKDWQAAWRTWCDKAVEFGRAGKAAASTQALSFAERDEMARRRRWEEMTGRKWPSDGVVDHAEIFDVVDATATREIGHEPANQSH